MKTNKFRSNKPAQGFWNGDRQQQRHFFNRALAMGWITTRGDEPMKLDELAFVTLCRAVGFHKGAEMEAFAVEQDFTPYFDEHGINFVVYWEDVLKNGPVGIDRIEFNQTGKFVTVYEDTPKGIKAREFKNSKSAYPKYGSSMFTLEKMALAHLHSSAIETGSNDRAIQLTDDELAELLK